MPFFAPKRFRGVRANGPVALSFSVPHNVTTVFDGWTNISYRDPTINVTSNSITLPAGFSKVSWSGTVSFAPSTVGQRYAQVRLNGVLSNSAVQLDAMNALFNWHAAIPYNLSDTGGAEGVIDVLVFQNSGVALLCNVNLIVEMID